MADFGIDEMKQNIKDIVSPLSTSSESPNNIVCKYFWLLGRPTFLKWLRWSFCPTFAAIVDLEHIDEN